MGLEDVLDMHVIIMIRARMGTASFGHYGYFLWTCTLNI